MAFDKKELAQFNLDESDVEQWKRGKCMEMFIARVRFEQGKAFKALMKDGAKGHDQNAGLYNAYDKVLSIIKDA